MIKLKPSLLRHTAIIQKEVISKDSEGIKTHVWTTVHKNVPCRVKTISGKELISLNQLKGLTVAEITVHDIAPIDESMRIVVNQRNYNITSINPDEYLNMYLKIMTESLQNG